MLKKDLESRDGTDSLLAKTERLIKQQRDLRGRWYEVCFRTLETIPAKQMGHFILCNHLGHHEMRAVFYKDLSSHWATDQFYNQSKVSWNLRDHTEPFLSEGNGLRTQTTTLTFRYPDGRFISALYSTKGVERSARHLHTYYLMKLDRAIRFEVDRTPHNSDEFADTNVREENLVQYAALGCRKLCHLANSPRGQLAGEALR